jgi:hypothetical protein
MPAYLNVSIFLMAAVIIGYVGALLLKELVNLFLEIPWHSLNPFKTKGGIVPSSNNIACNRTRCSLPEDIQMVFCNKCGGLFEIEFLEAVDKVVKHGQWTFFADINKAPQWFESKRIETTYTCKHCLKKKKV